MSNLKITTRVLAVIGFLTAMLLLIGGAGLWSTSQSNEALRTVYLDRTVPTADLAAVNRQNLRNRVAITYAIFETKDSTTDAMLKQIEGNMAEIDKRWKTYASTTLTSEEAALAKEFEVDYALLVKEGIRPAIEALQRRDYEAAKGLMLSKIRTLNTPTANALDKLIKLQGDVAKAEYEAAVARYNATRNVSIALIALAAVLANVFGVLLARQIRASLDQAVGAARAVAQGDLSHPITVKGKDEVAQLLSELHTMQSSLSSVVATVREGSESVATASSQIAQGNQDLSARTESQASALEETAASMEELSSTVRQNADNARQANQLAQSASSTAVAGGQVVAEVVGTMRDISDSSKKIADIISVIDGIAFQTNILALNAAVEAARAGEQGRGFAVVAGEVRTLASRSAEAAKEIKALITDSVTKVTTGTEQADRAGAAMNEVVASIRRVTDIMGEISAASTEQSQGVAQVGEAVTQMDQATQQNAALVEEMAAAASSLRGQAQDLVQAVSVFKLSQGATRAARPATTTQPHKAAPAGRIAPATKAAARPSPAPAKALATAPKPVATRSSADGDWESF